MAEYVIYYMLQTGSLKKEELATFKPSICNRLDRNTSGLITAGKSLAGLQKLGKLFKERLSLPCKGKTGKEAAYLWIPSQG